MALDEVPSRGEIKAFVSQMNNNKATVMDGLTAEILKNDGENEYIYILLGRKD